MRFGFALRVRFGNGSGQRRHVPDPDQRMQRVIDQADFVALEEAVRLREGGADVEIVAVGVGGEAALREALARGADRAILVCDDGPTDAGIVSHFLAGVFRREKADLVLIGGQTGPRLAGRLGLPHVKNIVGLEIAPEGESVRVVRETKQGRERLEVSLPAIVIVHSSLNKPEFSPCMTSSSRGLSRWNG